jgi:hypothetical protein
VSAGRLSVNAALASTAVTVSGGTLGGSGSIAGSVTVDNGGTLAPGNSIAVFTQGDDATFLSGSTFAYEVDSSAALGTAADLLVVNGDLDIASGSLLTFVDLNNTPQPFVQDTTIFALINYSGNWNGGLFTYGTNELADGERFSVGSQVWEIDYNRTSSAGLDNYTTSYVSGSFVTVTAVPEPSTYVMLAIAGGIAAVAARRRR